MISYINNDPTIKIVDTITPGISEQKKEDVTMIQTSEGIWIKTLQIGLI